MEVCYDCDIVFNEKNCPLCKAKDEIKSLEKYIENIENELRETNN